MRRLVFPLGGGMAGCAMRMPRTKNEWNGCVVPLLLLRMPEDVKKTPEDVANPLLSEPEVVELVAM
jgi:hypothetical protein